MRKIDDFEESQMYSILQNSILSLCDKKPENSINYLSNRLKEFCDEDGEIPLKSKKT